MQERNLAIVSAGLTVLLAVAAFFTKETPGEFYDNFLKENPGKGHRDYVALTLENRVTRDFDEFHKRYEVKSGTTYSSHSSTPNFGSPVTSNKKWIVRENTDEENREDSIKHERQLDAALFVKEAFLNCTKEDDSLNMVRVSEMYDATFEALNARGVDIDVRVNAENVAGSDLVIDRKKTLAEQMDMVEQRIATHGDKTQSLKIIIN
jgi:hypothetical protein